jgi:ATP-dependent Clp protease ATP-binding subunit ClpC
MSADMEGHRGARLIGAPPGYVGDDDGRLTDGKGRVVDFTNAILIATSNLGADRIQKRLLLRGTPAEKPEKPKAELMEVLRGHFRPEFLNRLDDIIKFHSLTKAEIRQIVLLQPERVKRTAASQGVTIVFEDSLIDWLAAEGYRPEYGARELKRQIRSLVETRLARALLGGEVAQGDTVRIGWDATAEQVVENRHRPGDVDRHPGHRRARRRFTLACCRHMEPGRAHR